LAPENFTIKDKKMKLDKRIAESIRKVCVQKDLDDLGDPLVRFIERLAAGEMQSEAIATEIDTLYQLVNSER